MSTVYVSRPSNCLPAWQLSSIQGMWLEDC